jgi:hypothetical protein
MGRAMSCSRTSFTESPTEMEPCANVTGPMLVFPIAPYGTTVPTMVRRSTSAAVMSVENLTILSITLTALLARRCAGVPRLL